MLDPDSISENHHVRIQQALVESGKWEVIDRASGYKALKKEQDLIHRNEVDRYSDREKWSRWGEIYSIGGVVIAHAACERRSTLFLGRPYLHCLQHLSIVNATTGQVIAAVDAIAEGETGDEKIVPSWSEAVRKLNNAFPDNYVPSKEHKALSDYKDQSEKAALEQKKRLENMHKVEEKNQTEE